MAKLTWLGHAGFLIESSGKTLAIDAWLDGPTFPGTSLHRVDVVAVTHGHFDHAQNAPTICNANGATLVCIHEIKFWAKQQGLAEDHIVSMNIGGTVEVHGFRLTMVPAVHSGGCPGDDGQIVAGGAAAGFIIKCPDGDVIYHAGDTAVFGDMRLIAEMYPFKLALLPIGGHFTMDPVGAAKAVQLLGAKHVVPMHYGTFPALAGTPAQLASRVASDVHIHVLEPGTVLDTRTLT